MKSIVWRHLEKRARKIRMLLVLIGLCSLFLGVPYVAWAAEAHVAHPSLTTFQHAGPPKPKLARRPASKSRPGRRPASKPLQISPSPILVNGRWMCSPPYTAEVHRIGASTQGPLRYTEVCVTTGLYFPCSDVLNLRTGKMQPNEEVISQDWLSGDAPVATLVGAHYFATGGQMVYTWVNETYGSPRVIKLFKYTQLIGFLFMVPSILLMGYELMVSAATFRYAGSLEGFSRLLLGGLAVSASFVIIEMLISFETLVMGAILLLHVEHPFPYVTVNGVPIAYRLANATSPGEPILSYRGIVMPLSRWGCAVNDFIGIFSVPFVDKTLGSIIPLMKGFTHLAETTTSMVDLMRRIGQMILMMFSAVLWVQVFVRIFLLNYYILTAPLAFGCWALPGGVGQKVVRLWNKGFFAVLFVQVLQIFLLTTLPLLLPAMPQIPTNNVGLIQGFLLEFPPILTLGTALMAPRLLGTSAGKAFGTAGSLVGSVIVAVTTSTSQMG
jgi:hypothetical protein